jgi:Flp pilus assembly pilin Flp
MHPRLDLLLALLRQRWRAAHTDDRGATAIEWAIFAILALTIAGLVAAAVTAAVNKRLPLIQ